MRACDVSAKIEEPSPCISESSNSAAVNVAVPSHSNLPLVSGFSRAGLGTALLVDLGGGTTIQFDCGSLGSRPDYFATRARYVMLSHLHLDHCAAVFLHARIRSMQGMKPATYFVPAMVAADFLQAKRSFEAMDNGGEVLESEESKQLNMVIHPVKPGEEVPLSANLSVRVCTSSHRVPSVGYCIIEVKHNLRSDLKVLDKPSLQDYMKAKPKDEIVTEPTKKVVVAYSGDTTIDSLDQADICLAETIIMEVTYLGGGKGSPVSLAQERGHIHLDELVHLLKSGTLDATKRFVLVHFSARYSVYTILKELKHSIPRNLLFKIEPMLDIGAVQEDLVCSYAASATAFKQLMGTNPTKKGDGVWGRASCILWAKALAEMHDQGVVAWSTFPLHLRCLLWLGYLILEDADILQVWTPCLLSGELSKFKVECKSLPPFSGVPVGTALLHFTRTVDQSATALAKHQGINISMFQVREMHSD
mmetsp:Transcript_13413/g.24842  ORF Transcript_13413/g.24842 Transcript_13413/m.24842 type:complete len:476 (-) Transcript_13413:251-1678(-)